MKILNVVSARPNFMKVAPILEEFKKGGRRRVTYAKAPVTKETGLPTEALCVGGRPEINAKLVHTGQHYDYEMSKIFFDELGIPEPDYHLGVGSGTHAEQTAKVMVEIEKVIDKEQPDWMVVVGDVNPTMACTVVAVKKGVKVAHVEAMPTLKLRQASHAYAKATAGRPAQRRPHHARRDQPHPHRRRRRPVADALHRREYEFN